MRVPGLSWAEDPNCDPSAGRDCRSTATSYRLRTFPLLSPATGTHTPRAWPRRSLIATPTLSMINSKRLRAPAHHRSRRLARDRRGGLDLGNRRFAHFFVHLARHRTRVRTHTASAATGNARQDLTAPSDTICGFSDPWLFSPHGRSSLPHDLWGSPFASPAYWSVGVRLRPTHVVPRPKCRYARRAQRCDRGGTMRTAPACLPSALSAPAADTGAGGPVARLLVVGGRRRTLAARQHHGTPSGDWMLLSPIGPPRARSPRRSMRCGGRRLLLRQRRARSGRGRGRGRLRGRGLYRLGCRG